VILLPVFGLVAGFAIGRREAVIVTAVGAAIGFTLVAIFTDEISGWSEVRDVHPRSSFEADEQALEVAEMGDGPLHHAAHAPKPEPCSSRPLGLPRCPQP
jgi:hypothetical protein